MNSKQLKRYLSYILIRLVDVFVHNDSRITVWLVSCLALGSKFYRNLRWLPIVWLDEHETSVRRELLPADRGQSCGPNVNGSQPVLEVALPSVCLHYFENARVCPLSSSILLSDDAAVIERVPGVDLARCAYASGHIVMHGRNHALVRTNSVEYLDGGVFLGGNGAFNYYHWMVEILPKVQFLKDIDEECGSLPLLVSQDVERIDTFRDALRRVVGNRHVIVLENDKTYEVAKLAVVNAPTSCPFNLRIGERFEVADFLTRPTSIRFLRTQLGCDLEPCVTGERKRIFFARRNLRRQYNQDEVYDIFRQARFVKVYMEDLSLQSQIDLVSNAEIIAGPTGAAWTNLIFCREGTKCLCWMAEESREFSAYSNLAPIQA